MRRHKKNFALAVAFILSFTLAFSLLNTQQANAATKNGKYKAQYQEYDDYWTKDRIILKVAVTFKNGKITKINSIDAKAANGGKDKLTVLTKKISNDKKSVTVKVKLIYKGPAHYSSPANSVRSYVINHTFDASEFKK